MYFHSLHSFLLMGGYAGYVWSAYGIVFGVLGYCVFSGMKKRRQLSSRTNVRDLLMEAHEPFMEIPRCARNDNGPT